MKLIASAIEFEVMERALFRAAPAESAAFMSVQWDGDMLRLRSFHVFRSDELEDGSCGHVAIDEEAQIRELAAIQRAGCAVIEVHTHPGSKGEVAFSRYDNEQLPDFARYVQNKLRGQPFGALVLGENGHAGRAWDADRREEPLELELVGESLAVAKRTAPASTAVIDDAMYDRQVRALGPEAQRRIAGLNVAIVGLGGTGSQAAQQLAHLGVRKFVLIDDDRVEASNLPRLAGARWWDVPLRRRKDAVATRHIRSVGRRARVVRPGTLRSRSAFTALRDADIIIGCVDNDGARLVLAELAAAYLIPYLDLGVGIEDQANAEPAIGGRTAFYLPGGACLACADELDFREAREDLDSEEAHALRVERGYARDRRVEPALMPLNTVVVGLGMIEFLAYFGGVRPVRPFNRYDARTGKVVVLNAEADADCPVCRAAHARGSRQQLERFALS